MSTSITPNPLKISLYLKTDKRDEEYHIDIIGNEQIGFTVQCMYGKRGSTDLAICHKNKLPVDFPTAVRIYDDTSKKLKAKGYTTKES